MEYEFKFTQEEAQILVDGLSELPIKQGIAVLQKLQTQFNKQKEKWNMSLNLHKKKHKFL